MTTFPLVRLQPARHKRVANGHPWVFSNEVNMSEATKSIEPGSLVKFKTHDGTPVGIGTFNPHSLIAGRIFSRFPLVIINSEWFATRFATALAQREELIDVPFYRLIHAEADGMPGLIIDRFGPHFSVQLNTAGMDRLWPEIEKALTEIFHPQSIVLHNESHVRSLEGLDREVKVVMGKIENNTNISENGLTYVANIVEGQKTGWYFDQRDNHALVASFAERKSVLDLYTHAGGFALLAARMGASKVIGVDSSAPALELAAKATELNKLMDICSWVRADVFEDLEARIAAKESYDIVVADPPPFVKSRKDVLAGARGYRKLATKAANVVAQGGLLFIVSCSHNMELPMFTSEVARGLHEAKREGKVLYTTFAAPDHPVHPHLPESAYLKGLLIRLD